jgi:hypothetical protein
MESVRRYLVTNFEQAFVLLILASVVTISYFIPYKLAFLNFYFIVIALGTYYLELQRALLAGVLCTLLVTIHTYVSPTSFIPSFTKVDLWMNIVIWFSFLTLTGAVVGRLSGHLKKQAEQLNELNRELEDTKTRLEEANRDLTEHATNLAMWAGKLKTLG